MISSKTVKGTLSSQVPISMDAARKSCRYNVQSSPTLDVVSVLDRDTLRHVVDLVNTDKTRGKLEHVVSQRNDDELCVLRPLLDI